MTNLQLSKFNEFLLNFIRLSHRRVIFPIYRDENLEVLYRKLGLNYVEDTPYSHKILLESLFMIGDKSRNYFSQEQFGLRQTWSFGINDCNADVFNFIFDTILIVLKNIRQRQCLHFSKRIVHSKIIFWI